MDRFWLKFRNDATEREYNTYAVRSVLRHNDVKFLYVMVVLTFAVLVKHCMKWESWVPVALDMVCMVYIVREVRFRYPADVGCWAEHRTARIFLSRTFFQSLHCVYSSLKTGFVSKTFPVSCIKTGAVFTTLFMMNLRMHFRHHLPFQIIATCMMLTFAIHLPCDVLMHSDGRPLVVTIANALNHIAEMIMVIMHGCYGLQEDRWDDWPVLCPCLHVQVWLYVFLILIVGSYVLWHMERSSRLAFIRTLSPDRKKSEGLDVINDLPSAEWMHIVTLLVVFALTWKLAYPVVYVIQQFRS